MSIQSEINRMSIAKKNIGMAIINKGVAVPGGTKLDGLATLIDSIKVVGDSGAEVYEICIKTKNRPTAASLVQSITYTSTDGTGALTLKNDTNILYLHYITAVVGTTIFIKTQNSPTSCSINDTNLESVYYDASFGAVVKVLSRSDFAGQGITFR